MITLSAHSDSVSNPALSPTSLLHTLPVSQGTDSSFCFPPIFNPVARVSFLKFPHLPCFLENFHWFPIHVLWMNYVGMKERLIWVEERSKWWKVMRDRLIVRGELKPGCTRKGVILSIPRESKQVNRLSGKASRIAPSGLFSHLWKIHIMKQVYIWINFCTKICSPFHSICHKSLKCLVHNFSGIPGMHGFQNFCTIINLIPFSLPVWNIYPVYIHISIFWSV